MKNAGGGEPVHRHCITLNLTITSNRASMNTALSRNDSPEAIIFCETDQVIRRNKLRQVIPLHRETENRSDIDLADL